LRQGVRERNPPAAIKRLKATINAIEGADRAIESFYQASNP
jgi:hypothetical protein